MPDFLEGAVLRTLWRHCDVSFFKLFSKKVIKFNLRKNMKLPFKNNLLNQYYYECNYITKKTVLLS